VTAGDECSVAVARAQDGAVAGALHGAVAGPLPLYGAVAGALDGAVAGVATAGVTGGAEFVAGGDCTPENGKPRAVTYIRSTARGRARLKKRQVAISVFDQEGHRDQSSSSGGRWSGTFLRFRCPRDMTAALTAARHARVVKPFPSI
jgi:hypothetical protein